MIGAWRRFVAITSHREPATALALYRIAIGLSVCAVLTGCWHKGVITPLYVDRAYGGYRALGDGPYLVAWLGGPTPSVVRSLFAASYLGGALLALGLGGRLTALFVAQTYKALVGINSHAGGSYDDLLINGLWLLVLAPATATLSLDCRLRRGTWRDDTPVSAWPRYLVVFQLVLMYWTTGLQKLSHHWVPGGSFDALWYIFQQPTWQKWGDLPWLAWVFPLTQVGTAVAWTWEVTNPLWLLAFWYRATRTRPGWLRARFNAWDVRALFAGVGVVLHAGIEAFMDVGPFGYVSLCFYVCLWHPDEWRAAWRRLTGR